MSSKEKSDKAEKPNKLLGGLSGISERQNRNHKRDIPAAPTDPEVSSGQMDRAGASFNLLMTIALSRKSRCMQQKLPVNSPPLC